MKKIMLSSLLCILASCGYTEDTSTVTQDSPKQPIAESGSMEQDVQILGVQTGGIEVSPAIKTGSVEEESEREEEDSKSEGGGAIDEDAEADVLLQDLLDFGNKVEEAEYTVEQDN